MPANKQNVETHQFGAETGKILQLMINSLYAHKDIFLRELISNASDACDKLRYEAITDDKIKVADELKIQIIADQDSSTLTVSDNGSGMNKKVVGCKKVVLHNPSQNSLEKEKVNSYENAVYEDILHPGEILFIPHSWQQMR